MHIAMQLLKPHTARSPWQPEQAALRPVVI
jgi:hypothetical protein